MVQLRNGFDFLEETLCAKDRRQLRSQDFDRHLAVMLEIFREVDRGHTTRTKLPLDDVAIGEGGGEAFNLIGHGTKYMAGIKDRLRIGLGVRGG